MANESVCSSCSNSIWCPTLAEWKCKAFEKRIYVYATMSFCGSYVKRDKNFKESKCQCDSCLENEMLKDEEADNKENLTTT